MLLQKFLVIFFYLIVIHSFRFWLDYLDYVDFILCPECSGNQNQADEVFDYIIVGCGSAGGVLARRLSQQKDTKILVLEAGRHGTKLLDIPSLGILLQNTRFDWQYRTVPQSTSCFALNNNVSVWPMGKIVGGTGMLNNLVYVRGHPEDFNEWFKDKPDYDYQRDVLPYFKKVENYGDNGDKGSVYVSDMAFTSYLPEFLLKAAAELGFDVLDSALNCPKGFSKSKLTILDGSRWVPSHAFVREPTPNLFLRTERLVEKILFHHRFEAYGVQYSDMGKSRIAKASKGVILSAGVVGSAKLLMLSGIGPRDHLSGLNIDVVSDLPVGDNLQDHLTTGLDLILLNRTLGIGLERMMSPYAMFEYFGYGTGPWTTGGCEILAYFQKEKAPHLQFMVMPLAIHEDLGVYLRQLLGISDQVWDGYFGLLDGTTAMTILPILLHPISRGTVRLKDKDPHSQPVIDPKYLTYQEDVDVLIEGIHLIKEVIGTDAMRELGARLNPIRFPGCEGFVFDTLPYWECYVRQLTISAYHPVGTCKMGGRDDETVVVDYEFAVKGTNKLFVVDGSVMPSLTSGNVNGAVFMLAEMAADVVKFRAYLERQRCHVMEVLVKTEFCETFITSRV